MIRLGTSAQDLDEAVGILDAGGLVAFPTETVYGLGADASNTRAVSRVFEVKGRPEDHPLIVHLGCSSAIDHWARKIPQAAWRLADAFWPGPMTLVLSRAAGVSDAVTGGQDSIALRVPGHPIAHQLLCRFDGGLAAPSANRFGRISPTTADHVIAELDDSIDAVVDGGACEVGLESTIIDLSGPQAKLLRPGMLSVRSIENVLGDVLQVPADDVGPRASGRSPIGSGVPVVKPERV
ncbi:MAG: threonylcarbamoyl-AMP synthase [Xanthomonadaceae bacterium]|nr:threonylcarbamoyl-AMP synthase [Xanthomonadaceae bacterium]